MSAILAIDPGATSGLAVISVSIHPELLHSETIRVKDIDPCAVIKCLCFDFKIEAAVIEDQYCHRNVDTLKKLVRNAGWWEQACRCNGMEVTYVMATSWQSSELGRGMKRAQLKNAAKLKAKALWKTDLKSDAADAAMLGRYFAMRTHLNLRRVD